MDDPIQHVYGILQFFKFMAENIRQAYLFEILHGGVYIIETKNNTS